MIDAESAVCSKVRVLAERGHVMNWSKPIVTPALADCILSYGYCKRLGMRVWFYGGADGKPFSQYYKTFGGCRAAALEAGYEYPVMSKVPYPHIP